MMTITETYTETGTGTDNNMVDRPFEAGAYETILVEMAAPHVAMVTLNRPDFANAFNTQMAHDLVDLFELLSTTRNDIRALILTGSGTRAFCAGGDLKERNGMSDDAWFAQHLIYERMARALVNCPLPLIGAINGAAFGGGSELTACCDFAFASDNAKFAQTEVKLGIIPGAGGTQLLTRAVGARRAKELILSGRVFSAEDAYHWGLVNAVLPADELIPHAMAIATQIAANAPIAVRQAKQAIDRGQDMGLAAGMAFEIECYNRTVGTDDRREGVRAFNEKRTAQFTGK